MKGFLLVGMGVLLISSSSCNKHTCKCTDGTISKEFTIEGDKLEAKDKCANHAWSGDGQSQTSANCELID